MNEYKGKNWKLYQGNMLDMREVIEPNSIDSIITDPPYGLTTIVKRFGGENSKPAQYGNDGSFSRLSKGFMGKEWDGSGIEYNVETWRKCYEVLKSGGYLLAFGGSRTFHRIACAIEDAGFEIRDTIMWLYGSGFPKSFNIGLAIDKKNGVESKVVGSSDFPNIKGGNYENNKGDRVVVNKCEALNRWNGWGTALKPSYEPIIVARKPCEGSCVDNVLKYGVGGINIDECRVGDEVITTNGARKNAMRGDERTGKALGMFQETEALNKNGRFPANTILTYDETDFDEVCGFLPSTETGSAARYFYCAKASKRDRDEGLDEFEKQKVKVTNQYEMARDNGTMREVHSKKNTHPTVKPTSLMQYLVRLVTPKGGTVLDPFNGSGSTGKAVMYENKDRNAGYKYIGIELTEEYIPIAKARIQFACNDVEEEAEEIRQMTIYDFIKG